MNPEEDPETVTESDDQTGREPSSGDLSSQLLAQLRANSGGSRGSGSGSTSRSGRGRRSRRGRSGQRGPGYSGPAPDDRDPQPISAAVDELVGDRGWKQPLAIGGVEGRWAEIVGTDIAEHCAPELFEAGRLTVRADSTAWATQLRLLAPTVLARLNDDLGGGTVTHLQVLAPKGPSWKKGRLRVKGRGPRDTYG